VSWVIEGDVKVTVVGGGGDCDGGGSKGFGALEELWEECEDGGEDGVLCCEGT
jgi:hypothetical protein